GLVTGDVAVDENSHDQQHYGGDDDGDTEAGTGSARGPSAEVAFGGGQGLGAAPGLGVLALSVLGRSALGRSGGLGLRRLIHKLVLAFQKSFDALFGVTDGIRQFPLCEVVGVEALTISVLCAGD